MIYLFMAVAICVSILTACVGWIANDIPLLALIGLIMASFTFGFILGENREQDN
jgi:hypothetical protein